MSFSPVKLVTRTSLALPLCSLVLTGGLVLALTQTGCEESQPPRGVAYPDVVGYDTPDQTPPPAPAAPSAPQQQQQLEAMQQGAAPGGQGQEEMAIGNDGEAYADTDPSALTDFRQALDPYGSWVDDPTYGTVWVPSESVVGDDFSPYVTAGHWAYGDDYVWVSDYDWGWAPFHYGRWTYMGGRGGWGWIPGREYAGAWVSWRSGYEGYVGWAPMPPTWGWRGGAAVGIGVVPPAAYTFCSTRDLFAPSLVGHGISGPQVATIAAHTQPYVAATPGVHTLAHPGVSGPVPTTTLHIPASQITRAPLNDRGLMRAEQFAHPNTAQVAGAHAPAAFTGGGQRYAGNYRSGFPGGAVAGHALLPRGSMMPAYGRPAGQMGTTRIGGSPYGSSYGQAYSYGARGGGSYYRGGGSTFRGGASYGSSFHGGGTVAPSASHYYGSPGGYGGGGGGGGHYSGGGGRGGGGGHGGGHR